MKQLAILTTFILFIQLVNGQTLSPPVAKIVRDLLSYDLLYQRCVGRGCSHVNRPYRIFLRLQRLATIKELLYLSKHDSSRIKAYAGWALIERKYQHLDSIFVQFLRTKETVFYAEADSYPIMDDLAHEFFTKLKFKAFSNFERNQARLFYLRQYRSVKKLGIYPDE